MADESVNKDQDVVEDLPQTDHTTEDTSAEDSRKKGKNKMGKIMKATIEDLETTLKDSQDLLVARDSEVEKLKKELEHYKHQAAKEVANKTKLAQSLDESTRQAMELENSLEGWQLSVREYQQQVQQLEAALMQERNHSVELEKRFSELYAEKSKEIDQLTLQLAEARKKTQNKSKDKKESSLAVESSEMQFLKQSLYHFLTDSRSEEHLRAIMSMLDFSAQERKAIYTKYQERKGSYIKNL